MKIVTFKGNNLDKKYRIGALVSETEIVDLTSIISNSGLNTEQLLECLDLENNFIEKAETIISEENAPRFSKDRIQLCASVPRPGKIICIGLNYRNHAIESGMEIPKSPIIFSKFVTCVIGSGDSILLPKASKKVDYEAEFAVVIGRQAKNVNRADAMDYVFGYTNFNDVSARDFQFADGQWQRGKSCDTFAPMGEFIATRDEIEDPHNLRIQFRLNGEILQDSNTNELIFQIPELIEFLSQSITLEPGDIIATGTPPGVGFARNPPIFMKAGDVAEVEIEGLGVLKNQVKG
ncbi:MAG TPA: fumarylacetoacetate hydrolase family protein [Pyrinomonadaceae bacterium]|nr:fumarylacetoacetate hydrolase family protein [Pyrinomonadaceae bacterium]